MDLLANLVSQNILIKVQSKAALNDVQVHYFVPQFIR